jgi:hypothetical protein
MGNGHVAVMAAPPLLTLNIYLFQKSVSEVSEPEASMSMQQQQNL